MTVVVISATAAEAAYVPEHLTTVLTGIGKVEAAAATAMAIAAYQPRVIVNVGTAGALTDEVAGLKTPSLVINHDLDADMIRQLGYPAIDSLELTQGDGTVLATGDLFVADSQVRDSLGSRAHLVDMEGFAIARVSQIFGIECRLVKVVSDSANSDSVDWPSAVDRCAREIGDWLEREYPLG